jgi:serine protease Do
MALAPEERPSAALFAEQAGRLRARWADRDGRGELRDWLASLRTGACRDGHLDDLIGLLMIRVDEDRSYVIEREEPSGKPTEPGKRGTGAATIPWIRPDGEPAIPTTRPSPVRSERPAPASGPSIEPSASGPSWRPPPSVAPVSVAPAAPAPRRRLGLVIGILAAGAAAALLIAGVSLAVVLGEDDGPVRAQRTIHLPPVDTPPLIVPIDPTTVFDHTYEGELVDGDPRHPQDDSPIDDYFFTAPAGASMSLTLESESFDPYLILLGPEGRVIQQNDDAARGELTARIERVAEREGAYRVVVNTARPSGRGPYRLHIVVRPRP